MNENWIINKLKGSYKIVFQQIDEMIKLPRIERQDDEKIFNANRRNEKQLKKRLSTDC